MSDVVWTEEMSRVYAGYMESNVKHDHRRWAEKIAADWPEIQPGATVVDVAGGPAFLLLEMASRLKSPRLICTDADPLMIEIAEKRAAKRGVKIETLVCPADHLTLSDNTADMVICKHFLRFATDLAATLKETARILKPGGRAYFVDFNAEGPLGGKLLLTGWIWATAPDFLRKSFWSSMKMGLPASSLPPAMQAAGFSHVKILRSGVSYLIRAVK